MTELELALRKLGDELAWPEAPDLASTVRRRIETAPERRFRGRGRALAIALTVLAVAVGAVMAVPPARTAVLDWLGFGGVEIRRVAELPAVPSDGRLVLGERVSLARARALSEHPVLLPDAEGFGRPDAVYVDRFAPGKPVALVYGPLGGPRLLVLEFRAAPLIEKALLNETRVERIEVNGAPGLWIEGPRHEFFYRTLEREAMRDTQRLAGNTLLWTRGPLTLRIEGDFSKAEAIRIAESTGT
jgi:hypothetical protein